MDTLNIILGTWLALWVVNTLAGYISSRRDRKADSDAIKPLLDIVEKQKHYIDMQMQEQMRARKQAEDQQREFDNLATDEKLNRLLTNIKNFESFAESAQMQIDRIRYGVTE